MDYNHITSFLSKFKQLVSKDELYREAIVKIISKEISNNIDPNTIKIKGTTIYIKGSPILHNEILIRKSKILSGLSELLKESRFTDIN